MLLKNHLILQNSANNAGAVEKTSASDLNKSQSHEKIVGDLGPGGYPEKVWQPSGGGHNLYKLLELSENHQTELDLQIEIYLIHSEPRHLSVEDHLEGTVKEFHQLEENNTLLL